MQFYNREIEIERLSTIWKKSFDRSQMVLLMGRRRIGKTRLLLHAFGDKNYLYLFVSKKSSELLAREFVDELKNKLNLPIFGNINSTTDVLKILFNYAEKEPITVIIDEFQNFLSVEASVFSELQKLWDLKRDVTRMNLILCGSIYSIMYKIFQDYKEPLFGRADFTVKLSPFSIQTQKDIWQDTGLYSLENLVDFYAITGGVPKYVEFIVNNNCVNRNDLFGKVIRDDSYLLNEGNLSLIDEFGKDYSIYFSILQLISEGYTSRGKLSSVWSGSKELGGYLKKLEQDYSLIKKNRPLRKKRQTKDVRYQIEDNFLSFWFRFIFKYQRWVESKNYTHLRELIMRDWTTYLGKIFEKMVREILSDSQKFSMVGGWWDRKGENEIDIVAIDELNKRILIGECKLNKEKINLSLLRYKAEKYLAEYSDYEVYYQAFSPDGLDTILSTEWEPFSRKNLQIDTKN